jgi:PiT family inorganic phosphate transporter
MGVGSAHNIKAVRWGVTYDIVIAWIVTLPASAMLGALFTVIYRHYVH